MPIVISDQERHRRVVEEGSNRKRDLAGYRRIEVATARERLDSALAGPAAMAAWEQAMARIRGALPESTFAIWLAPLRLVGTEADRLFLSAPDDIRAWVERRYSRLLREALRGTDYSEVEFVASKGIAR